MIPIWLKFLPWKWIGIAVAVIGLYFGAKAYIAHVDRSARSEQKEADAKEVRLAKALADAAALKRKVEVAQERDKITRQKDDEYGPQLADARARAAAYAKRLRDEAAKGSTGRSNLPSTAEAAALVDGPNSRTIISLSDLDACTVNTVRLQNVQAWWLNIEKGPQ